MYFFFFSFQFSTFKWELSFVFLSNKNTHGNAHCVARACVCDYKVAQKVRCRRLFINQDWVCRFPGHSGELERNLDHLPGVFSPADTSLLSCRRSKIPHLVSSTVNARVCAGLGVTVRRVQPNDLHVCVCVLCVVTVWLRRCGLTLTCAEGTRSRFCVSRQVLAFVPAGDFNELLKEDMSWKSKRIFWCLQ